MTMGSMARFVVTWGEAAPGAIVRRIEDPVGIAAQAVMMVRGETGRVFAITDARIYHLDAWGELVAATCWGEGAQDYPRQDRYWALALQLYYEERRVWHEYPWVFAGGDKARDEFLDQLDLYGTEWDLHAVLHSTTPEPVIR